MAELILTRKSFYEATDEEIVELGKRCGGVYIAYGSCSYNKKLSRLIEMFDWIKRDYPHIVESDVALYIPARGDSDWIAGCPYLEFKIPAEEFIRLRNRGELDTIESLH